ncbi:PREDICTED: isoamylase 2, chloroplastic [Nelumbo nucifera]|uniref:Isoamylase 2, chloroplastic n=2 Tax=Nelumbo nucifera TaxID=4432 RepID=A0A1U8BBA3_NELNU|nr:PREDICTED: isoamylase 2, chloroplastic [Nelumbo nucifera]XP_010278628.1 PREDICTED: isoamylase 2, chloroplastic [Nelumbo nucifera]DAD33563.1 TPA_asm: hypothetical protein HUJ06_012414 [Nelumbo nucifera]
MATPLSLTIEPHCLYGGSIKMAKLATATSYYAPNKCIHRVRRIDMGRSQSHGCLRDITKNAQWYHNLKIFASSPSSVDQTRPSLGTFTKTEEVEKPLTYLFRTEIGGQVKITVGRKNTNYTVCIEVSSLPQCNTEDKLFLNWGIFRSDSSCLTLPGSQVSAPETHSSTMETPLMQKSSGRHFLQLEFESNQAPFYLSFMLLFSSNTATNNSEIRSHRKTNFCVPVGISSGHPAPLGISFSDDGSVNFSLFSRNAESVVLCLYDEKSDQPSLEIDLDPYINRTGNIWHVSMESVAPYVSYGYRCKGDIHLKKGDRFDARNVLLDPYAKILSSSLPNHSETHSPPKRLGHLCKIPTFDWSGDIRPCLEIEELVVYRLNVRRFTEDKSCQLPADVLGTFSGLIEKLHHFKSLGVNAVLLEPVFSFGEQNGPYFPYHFFSASDLYGPSYDNVSTINSMKEMIKRLHANGIEVLLEVVFTHAAEGGDSSFQTISFRGIDNSSYYILNGDTQLGTRNALNCNNPIVQRMILDILQYWVTEFHIDGFCFMNASSLLRGLNGEYLSRPPLVEAIAFDPLLSKTKIIADCWDPCEMVTRDIRFPHWKRWAEVNNRFCHDIRKFLRGEGLLSDLATRLCGSGDIFLDGRGPAFSFNFIARNFGLPLVDLVSFSGNEVSSELSWNCGEEGATNNTVVLERRLKQIRNFLFILYISFGVPILNMGDECGQSSSGSTSYGDRKPFDWTALRTGFAIQTTEFIAFLSSLRTRRSDLLQKRNFLKVENIEWYGSNQSQPRWEDPSSKFLALRLKSDIDNSQSDSDSSQIRGDLFIAFNAGGHSEGVILPSPSEGMVWLRLVDTALPFPGFFSNDGDPVLEQMQGLIAYEMKAHSCALFEARSLVG